MAKNVPVTSQELQRAADRLAQRGLDIATATCPQIAQACGITERRARTLKEKLKLPIEASFVDPTKADPSVVETYQGDVKTLSLRKTRIHTLDELVAYCEIDLSVWEVEKFVANKWEGILADNAGVQELFQVKAWLRRRKEVQDAKAEIELLKAEAKKTSKVYPKISHNKLKSGYMLEVSLPDLHVAKLAWAKETGYQNYDTKIAEQVFEDALTALLERTASYTFDRILFVVGNDLLHSDNREGTTTAGTPLDMDGRFQRSFVIVRKMITRAIERMRFLAPVDVLMVPGNHDTLSVWHLGDSLECLFHQCDDVAINNDPTPRKYYQWGQVMLMHTHGNKGKLTDYPLVMATEQPKMFGETKHREAHTGDKHQLKVHELHGVRVRISPALCPPDAWHAESMFVGNPRSAEAFVWHKDEGLVATAIYTVNS